jgi:Flp pilus assembly protein TadD
MNPGMDAGIPPRAAGAGRGRTRSLAGSLLAVALLALVAFWPVTHNAFVNFDDDEYITRNAVVARGVTAEGVALAFTKSYAANWHPLTWISHMVDVELFGLDPRAHHFVGLALHGATALLLLATLRAMTGLLLPSLLVAALFAVHPLHVESVAWAAERKDVLSGLFWTLAVGAHLRYARRPGTGRYLAVLLLFALGVMAKPMVVTLPLVLLVLDYWPLGRFGVRPGAPAGRGGGPAVLLEKLPLLALSLLAGLVAIQAQRAGGAVASLSSFPLPARAANALLSAAGYLAKTLVPSGLAVFYPFRPHALGEPAVLAAGALLAAASLAAWRLRRTRPWNLAGWLWYLVTILPVIGLIQVGEQAMADRYTYLPLVGVFVAAGWGIAPVLLRRSPAGRALRLATVAALLLLVALTRRQTAVWRNDETLFGHAIRVTTGNWKALYSLGLARDAAGDREGAERLYREAIRTKPDFSVARYSLAMGLDERGRSGEALAELREAARALPGDPVIRMALALMLDREGLTAEAIVNLRDLVRLRPDVAMAYNNLAVLLTRQGETGEAGALLRRALELDPGYGDARRNLEALTGERPPEPAPSGGAPGLPRTHGGPDGASPAR